jgi:iron-sulfur cluster repair protein YtfE (RIC family)
VRQRILREHESLRKLLEDLHRAASALEGGGSAALRRAIGACERLYAELRDHLDLEDQILAPALREADAWGEVRAGRLLQHHVEQRRELQALQSEPPPADPQSLKQRIESIVSDLRSDMAYEERELLATLRDDVLGIDVEDG